MVKPEAGVCPVWGLLGLRKGRREAGNRLSLAGCWIQTQLSPSPASLSSSQGSSCTTAHPTVQVWDAGHDPTPHFQPCPRWGSEGAVPGLCHATDFSGLSRGERGEEKPFCAEAPRAGGLDLAAGSQCSAHRVTVIPALQSTRRHWGTPLPRDGV